MSAADLAAALRTTRRIWALALLLEILNDDEGAKPRDRQRAVKCLLASAGPGEITLAAQAVAARTAAAAKATPA